jgi:transcriptional regulator with XRE-family HTH domain
MRTHFISDSAKLVRSARLHAGIDQQALAKAVGKPKAWLAKRELGFARMGLQDAEKLVLAILDMAETGQKNDAKSASLPKLDKRHVAQVTG